MSRARTRRPGTRAGTQGRRETAVTDAFPHVDPRQASQARDRRKQAALEFPDDLPSAALAALDDLIQSAETGTGTLAAPPADPPREPRTRPPPAPGARQGATSSPGAASPSTVEPRARLARLPTAKPRAAPTLARGRAAPRVATSAPLDDNQLVEETVLPALPVLRFAVFEDPGQLAPAQDAIVAAGHVAQGAAGRDAAARIAEVVRQGGIDAVLVALPGGESIIDAALALEPRRPLVIAALAGSRRDATRRAIAAGADLVTTRPHDLERLAPVMLAAARLHVQRDAALNARGNEAVLRARLDEIAEAEPRGLQPFEVFQRQLEVEIKRARRFEYTLSVALFAVEIEPPPPPAGIRGILRARAGNALIHTIRDIDLATQLDHERFLVLLPYTDLAGAANLAQRVIAAVAAGDPVTSAGRSFPPRVVGAVTGARPGDPISFAKLMKDATRALDQARRDGAELAVQP